tara:strand:- start:8 stop:130 length:123 start_codon:yes stop_codon:yes gene_type:complete
MLKVYLDINVSHVASAAVMNNGTIVATAQKEKFTKICKCL